MEIIKTETTQSVDDGEYVTHLPIYRLCCAILFKAYEDLESDTEYAESAYDWIFTDNFPARIPMEQVCDVLQVSKVEVRRKARLILSKELSVKQSSPLRPSVV